MKKKAILKNDFVFPLVSIRKERWMAGGRKLQEEEITL